MPVDYWDYLGWKDTLADPRFTARQRAYSNMRGDRDIYTPQVVINGSAHVIGSDRAGIEGAISTPQGQWRDVDAGVDDARRQANQCLGRCQPGPAPRTARSGSARSRRRSRSRSGAAKIADAKITYHNVVRNLLKVGDWTGIAGSWTVPLENISREGVDAAVVYVQDGKRDRPGPMLGAAHVAALNHLHPVVLGCAARQADRFCSRGPAAAGAALAADHTVIARPKKKGPTLVGPVWGFSPLRTGPIPTAPGGWGLRNPEPKGPGQRSDCFFARQRGGRLAEVGQYYDFANDPVTPFSAGTSFRRRFDRSPTLRSRQWRHLQRARR